STEIDDLASQCVKCGLCLPHCPTYTLTENENESPRGRIALMQAIAKEELPYAKSVDSHLDNCLACRTCERVCPAHVQYGELITKTRHLTTTSPKIQHQYATSIPLKAKFLSRIASNSKQTRLLGQILRLVEISKIRTLSKKVGLTKLMGLQSLDDLLPNVPSQKPFKAFYPTNGSSKGKVGLFKGCISTWSDRKTLEASIFVLNKLGFDVVMPQNQGCCGAMALHHGDFAKSSSLAKSNLNAFA